MVFLMALKSPFGNNIILNLLFKMKKLPKCGIGTQCRNFGNSLSRNFGKNSVKVADLLNKLLKSWFDERSTKKIVKTTREPNQYFFTLEKWLNIHKIDVIRVISILVRSWKNNRQVIIPIKWSKLISRNFFFGYRKTCKTRCMQFLL